MTLALWPDGCTRAAQSSIIHANVSRYHLGGTARFTGVLNYGNLMKTSFSEFLVCLIKGHPKSNKFIVYQLAVRSIVLRSFNAFV
jgi:hypothetical protein